jgi:photosystem II stability/assembly factor-like uncharacterized protein
MTGLEQPPLEPALPERSPADDVVYALAASPGFALDGVCFAACQSGLYRSRDGGQTWHSAYGSLSLNEPLATTAVAVSPEFGADRTVVAGARGGVLVSTDGGDRWQTAMLPLPPPNITALAFSPNFVEDGALFAGTLEDGIFCSADRGRHWSAANFGLLDLNVFCLAVSPAFAGDETIFLGAESGIFHSTNGGRSWREVDFPIECAPVLSLAFSPNYATDGCLLAGTEDVGLLRSLDQGQTWAQLSQAGLLGAVNAILPAARSSGGLELLAMLPQALLISRDSGQSWSNWKAGPDFRATFTSIAAPAGLGPDAPLLVGLSDGQKLRL